MAVAPASERVDEFYALWQTPGGLRGFFTAVNHKVVGARYMVTAFVLFLVGGLQALLLRVQLARPENDVLGPQQYNELFTMHGTTMMFLFVLPFLEGLATYLLPLQMGARDMPFPRYNAFNYWCFLSGGLILYSSFLFALVPDAGWFAYVPLSSDYSGKSIDFWLFGLTLAEIAAIGAAVEIGVTVLRMRPPGMSLARMPIFAWAMLATAFLIVVAFVPLVVNSVLLELDRALGMPFFDPGRGGDPLLWQHLFWIFGHPEVYVMFLPAAAIISHVIPVHAARALVAYPLVVVAIVVTAIISLGLWVHHMYTTGLPPLTLSFFTAASMTITLASGLQVFAWIATLYEGRPRATVPMLYTIGFLLTFVAGGITGVMVASVPFDEQVHDTFFVVAHFHYVLIGGVVFPMFAGLYHWWPKFTGRMLDDRLGKASFWLVFLGFHTTFFPLHLAGLWGMPRRVYTYPEGMGLEGVNLLATVGAFVLAAGVLLLTAALLLSLRRGTPAPADPWGGDSLEWALASPPPQHNFARIPVVTSRYPVWDLGAAGDQPDGQDPAGPPPAHLALADAFDHKPEHIRATPTTSVVTAEPDGAARLALPTAWPVAPAAGLAVVAAGILLGSWSVAGLGVATVVGGLAGWAVHNERERRAEDDDATVGGFPLEPPGTRSLTFWAAAAAGVLGVVFTGTVVFSGLYLQVNAERWPDGQSPLQPWAVGAVAVLLAVAAGATWWAARLGDSSRSAALGHRAGALVALLAGAGALAVLVLAWADGPAPYTLHAYYSVVVLLQATVALLVLFAAGLTAVAVLARTLHRRSSRPTILLRGSSLLWGVALLAWILTFVFADVAPRAL